MFWRKQKSKSTACNIVATTNVGIPETLSEKQTIVASFHDFKSLPHKKGDKTLSSEMTCHGHKWRIALYPGGDKNVNDGNQTWTSVYLTHASVGKVKANIAIRVGSSRKFSTGLEFDDGYSNTWGWQFLPHNQVLDPTKGYLKDGTLEVEVDIQVYADRPQAVIWSPRNRLSHDLLESLQSGKEGNLCITVGSKQFMVFKDLVALVLACSESSLILSLRTRLEAK